MVATVVFATELTTEGPPDFKPETCKVEPIIKVNIKWTVDNVFNFFTGNKLRATKFIKSGTDWKIQHSLDVEVVKGEYLYMMAWSVNDNTPPSGNYQMFLAEVNYKICG